MRMDVLKYAHDLSWRDFLGAGGRDGLRRLSLTQHLLMLALIPTVLLLASFFLLQVADRMRATEPAGLGRGLAAVRLMAAAAEFGVYFRHPEQLEQIIDTLSGLDELAAVSIYDNSGRVLVQRGQMAIATKEQLLAVRKAGLLEERSGRMAIAAPVMAAQAAREEGVISAFYSLTSPQPGGWVVLELDSTALAPPDGGPMSRFALLVLVTLVGSACMALRLALALKDSMATVSDAVQRIRAGHWEVRVPLNGANRELRSLQEDFNALAGSLDETRQAMRVDIEEAAGHFAYQAMHDHLTGLLNRRAFDEALAEALLPTRRLADRCALCYIDLDYFKMVNDLGGHAAGDALLCEVASLIRQGVRAEDQTFRIGGDEFGVILRGCSVEAAMRIAESLCRSIAELQFEAEGRRFMVSASCGLVIIDEGVDSPLSAMKMADAACYAAKREGRNQVVLREEGLGD